MTKWQAAKAAGDGRKPNVRALCRAIRCSHQTFYNWGRYPPMAWQERIRETYPQLKVSSVGSYSGGPRS